MKVRKIMSYKSSTSDSATFNFQADLSVECFDDRVEIEVDQSILRIENQGNDVYASFEALVVMTDLENPNNKAHIRFGVRRLRLFNLEKSYSCNASSDSVIVEKITSEDEEVRRKFYDIIDDWIEFDLNVYVAD